MKEVFETSRMICPGLADASGMLGIPDTFGLFMDIASEHAELLGCGYDFMRERGLFWLTVKTKVHITERPRLGEIVTLRTWPEKPGTFRCVRSYELLRNGSRLICGKTEWAVYNSRENRVTSSAGIFPEELSFQNGTACDEPFSRIPDDFSETAPYGSYTVRSTDIDVGHHMNNAAYLRALAGSYSCEEWAQLPFRKMEVHFRTPCYEGDDITFQRRQQEEGISYRMAKGDSTLFLARMEF